MLQPWEQYDDDTLGGFEWGRNIIQPAVGQGVNFGLNWLANRGNRQGGQQQLRGSGLIDQMSREYQAMQSAGASVQERLQFLQAALQVVNDPQYGPWDSEPYRQQAVEVWTNAIRVLQGQTTSQPAATGTTPGTLTPSPAAGGIDNKTLLMFGGAAVILLMLWTRD